MSATGELDLASGVPLYRQIKDILRTEVTEGVADPSRPMTEALLLERFDVSRAPIRQALKELADEGYVYRKQGKGTFPVPGTRVSRPADVQPGRLYQYLDAQGLHPASRVTGLGRVEPPEHVAGLLQLREHERLLHFQRHLTVDEQPLAVIEVYVRAPEEFTPGVAELEETGSAFLLLERDFGLSLELAEHEAWAAPASPSQALALGVGEGEPLLIIETTFFAVGGLPVGWRTTAHRAEEFKYRFVTAR